MAKAATPAQAPMTRNRNAFSRTVSSRTECKLAGITNGNGYGHTRVTAPRASFDGVPFRIFRNASGANGVRRC